MSDIFREIEDELRRDNLLKLWRKYGWHIAAVVVVIMLIAGGVVAWRDHQATQRRAESARYSSALAMLRDGKDADAAKVFAMVAGQGGGYGVLSAFQDAALLAKTGDRKGAIAAYDRIAASGEVDRELRDLAVLLSVMQALPDGDPQAQSARLAPLTESGNPWRPTALELTAAARLKAGDRNAALDIYKKLADDLSAPEGLRARAAEMTAALTAS